LLDLHPDPEVILPRHPAAANAQVLSNWNRTALVGGIQNRTAGIVGNVQNRTAGIASAISNRGNNTDAGGANSTNGALPAGNATAGNAAAGNAAASPSPAASNATGGAAGIPIASPPPGPRRERHRCIAQPLARGGGSRHAPGLPFSLPLSCGW
jgi:hypothetical protein